MDNSDIKREEGPRLKLRLTPRKMFVSGKNSKKLYGKLHQSGVILSPFAREIFKTRMEADEQPRCLAPFSAKNLGFKHDVTIGEFYSIARATPLNLCPVSDGYRFAIEEGQEVEGTIYLAMMPVMCSDKRRRVLAFRNDAHEYLHVEALVLPEDICFTNKFLFRLPEKRLDGR